MNTKTVTTFPRLLAPPEAAELIGVSVQTMAQWRSNRRYKLSWCRIGRKIFYKEADLLAFVESRRVAV